MRILMHKMMVTLALFGAIGACERVVGIEKTKLSPSPGTSVETGMNETPDEIDAGPVDLPATTDGADGNLPIGNDSQAGGSIDGMDGAAGNNDLSVATDGTNTTVDAGVSPDIVLPQDASPEAPLPACLPATSPAELDRFSPSSDNNCSFPTSIFPYTVAVDDSLYDDAKGCGACMEITGAKGTIVAMVIDNYPTEPSSKGNRISINGPAMDRIGSTGDGTVSGHWRWVPCPLMGSITAAMTSDSDSYGWQFILRNHVNAIAKVEFLRGQTWTTIEREDYNYFVRDSETPFPTRLRITDRYGNVVTTDAIKWPSPVSATISLKVQLPPFCAL